MNSNNALRTLEDYGPRILIVDDDPDVLDVARRLLQAYDLSAEVFQTADALLATVSKTDFGCALRSIQRVA